MSLACLTTASHAETVHIELALQEGGEGPAIYEHLAREFEATHPNVKVDIQADPRIVDKLRMRILERNFPS